MTMGLLRLCYNVCGFDFSYSCYLGLEYRSKYREQSVKRIVVTHHCVVRGFLDESFKVFFVVGCVIVIGYSDVVISI